LWDVELKQGFLSDGPYFGHMEKGVFAPQLLEVKIIRTSKQLKTALLGMITS